MLNSYNFLFLCLNNPLLTKYLTSVFFNFFFFSALLLQAQATVIEDFESGLPMGNDINFNPVGFLTFAFAGDIANINTTNTPPSQPPGAPGGNNVLALQLSIPNSFAGFVYNNTNAAVDTWLSLDWSNTGGISFWLYGNATGNKMFFDVFDNRNPGSTIDDAERWRVPIVDDFSGWQYFEFTWDQFSRQEIGNGAPNDGFGLTETHGYALGAFSPLGGSAPVTFFMDDVALLDAPDPIPTLSQ